MERQSVQSLKTFLETNSIDVTTLSLAEFRDWLQNQVDCSASQELFRARCEVRDILRQHRRRLSDRKRRLQTEKDRWQRTIVFSELQQLHRQKTSLQRGVEGLSEAVKQNRASPEKLEQFRQRLSDLTQRESDLLRSTPLRRRYQRAVDTLRKLEDSIGLTEAMETARHLATEQGNAAQRSGSVFECRSAEAVQTLLVPEFRKCAANVTVLHGATLRCARGEFDHLIVGFDDVNEPVEVLAMIEAKRNPNDIPHGFRLRQENLAWFVNDTSGFSTDLYRTSLFRSGLFDKPIREESGGRELLFDRTSFSRFVDRDCGPHRVGGLYFVTESRFLTGTTSAELSRILYLLSTDPAIKLGANYRLPDSDSVLRRLRKRFFRKLDPLQARHVLELYGRSESHAGQIILLGSDSSEIEQDVDASEGH